MQEYSLEEISSGLQTLAAPRDTEYVVSINSPGNNYLQETDTFDTWFSSSQWPVVALQNAKPNDFDRFYPTQLMNTGYDILPFWVMRMLMMGYFLTNKLPFKTVYLHGLIRDAKGDKMSKSKGNTTNPIDVLEKYGADALRMALVIRSSAGLDKSIGEPDFKAARNLCNKLWNATRFVLMMIEDEEKNNNIASKNLDQPTGCRDKQQLSKSLDNKFQEKLSLIIDEISGQLNRYQIGLAAETTHNHFWHWFCDECIEQVKNKQLSLFVLVEGLVVFLKLFHPFMPFITEQLWQELINKKVVENSLLITSSWPGTNPQCSD